MSKVERVLVLCVYLAVAAVLALLLNGCGDDKTSDVLVGPPLVTTGTCESCHQDAEMLQATMEPSLAVPPEADPGEG